MTDMMNGTPAADRGGVAAEHPGQGVSGEGGVGTYHHGPNVKPREEIFAAGTGFTELGLAPAVLKGVQAAGFEKPTGIQATLIPAALKGKDILGQAKTGTGKTAAFGLPLLSMIEKGKEFQAIVLAPTRELALQIAEEITHLGQFTGIKVAPVFGGQAVAIQSKKLSHRPEILVGTPGRFMDMMERGLIHLKNVRFAVLDEVDRMLDIGFRDDIRRILGACPKAGPVESGGGGRQTIFVSATISGDIDRLARSYMHEPEKLVVAAGSLTVSLVEQHYLSVQAWDKKKLLLHLLTHEEPALTIVFCRLKRTVDELARFLNEKGVEAHAIHGDMPQGKRNSAMKRLREGRLNVMIASDVASRGIDAEGVSHVINYDLPDDVELYVHRIGRTARAGRGGVAWSFVTPDQGGLLTDIERLINAEIPKLEYPGFTVSEPPREVRDREQAERARRELQKKPARLTAELSLPVEVAAAEAAGPAEAAVVDASKFPGGVVPTKLPPKRMFGKIRSTRR